MRILLDLPQPIGYLSSAAVSAQEGPTVLVAEKLGESGVSGVQQCPACLLSYFPCKGKDRFLAQ